MKKISEVLEKLAIFFTVAAVAVMTLITFVQVITRYVFGFSLTWSEEFARYLFIWITFIGGSIAFRRLQLTSINIIVDKLPQKARFWILLVADLLVGVFLVVIVIYGIKLIYSPGVVRQLSPAMQIPMGIPYIAVPLGGFLMLVHNICHILDKIVQIKRGPSPVAQEQKG
ncbi:TRAP transporter small permease [Calderihabitans maritimus]|uniref:Tripartite AtP-independent periplasmic transporter subunit DctQ n=1 Tax=Calderihabitans maritimus TaxID=1246530 RepID=A0A1Z5HW87_9FIRM|nr:TRAP transporter small permease [Calderihabitans maritimus]GAW93799.1 tripartite AtP-independent periplasmic transporter subunit DctQ [Calderihabitans maritimus]